jgi:hypothetical protein
MARGQSAASLLILHVEERLTPQKKWRMKMMSTRRGTFFPVYRLLKGCDFPFASSTVWFSSFFRVACEGSSSFVSTSPAKSGGFVSLKVPFVLGKGRHAMASVASPLLVRTESVAAGSLGGAVDCSLAVVDRAEVGDAGEAAGFSVDEAAGCLLVAASLASILVSAGVAAGTAVWDGASPEAGVVVVCGFVVADSATGAGSVARLGSGAGVAILSGPQRFAGSPVDDRDTSQ